MCGICGLVTANGDRPDLDVVRRMSARLVHRGPDSDGLHAEGPVALAARRLSIIDLEGGTQPIANEDGTVVVVQNGEIYNYRELRRGAGAQRPPLRDRLRHRGAGPHVRGARRRVRRAPARDVRDRGLGLPCLAPASRPRPFRDQAALLPSRRRDAVVCLGAEGDARAARVLAPDRPPCRRRVPDLQLGPGADDDLRRGAEAAGGLHARMARRRDRDPALRPAEPGPGRRCPQRAGGSARRRAARDAPRLRPRPPRRRRPGRRPALRRGRLGGADGACRRRVLGAGPDLLDRVRGGELRRARARPVDRRPLPHRPPRADPAPRRRRAPAEPGRGLRRAVRRLLGGPDLPRLASWPRARSRSPSRARAATSCSAATTPTSPTSWPRRWRR